MSRDARLLFIQLWTVCDDAGRARGDGRLLASLLYPYDEDAKGLIVGWLEELEAVGAIRRYVVDGDPYLDIPKWLNHQKIERPTPSKLPSFDDRSVEIRESSPKAREDSPPDLDLDLDREMDLDREQGTRLAPRRASPADLRDVWNELRGSLPECRELSDKRKVAAQARIRGRPSLEDWRGIISRIAASEFCNGAGATGWVATFDWLVQPDTDVKVLEGKYDNRPRLLAADSRTGESTAAALSYLRGKHGPETEQGGSRRADREGAVEVVERPPRKTLAR